MDDDDEAHLEGLRVPKLFSFTSKTPDMRELLSSTIVAVKAVLGSEME